MSTVDFHRLLRRQIRKAGLSEKTREEIAPLLSVIDEAYRSFDIDMENLENVLERSSQELFKANQLLKEDIQQKSRDLQIANRTLERVVNNVREVIFQTDLEGNWTFLNSAWEEVTPFTIEEALGQHYSKFLVNVENPPENFIELALAHEISEYREVVKVVRPSGEIKWLDLDLRVTQDEQGNPDGTIGSIIDITSIKETEFALIKSREDEKKANQAKNEFLSTMSHEIRTPLNAVIGLTNLLQMSGPREDQIENLNALSFSSKHLLSVINDILDFNKIESGKIEFEQSDFSPHALIRGLSSTFSHHAKEKGLRWVVKLDESLPRVLVGDSTRLSQVLSNLMSNAIKFTAKGSIVIDIEVVEESGSGITLRFEVKDTGIGIPEEKLATIFDSFTQAEIHTTRKYGGTGLGLTICKKLLELQGSELEVYSRYGKGTSFFFELSFGVSNRLDAQQCEFVQLQPSFMGLDGLKILVAEDNKMNVMVLRQLLRKWNVEMSLAKNGEEALESVQQDDYDLILMDLQMPKMDGYSASRAIRALEEDRYKHIPIIALTASAQIHVQESSTQAGMNDYLSKPFDPVDLYNKLKKYKPVRST